MNVGVVKFIKPKDPKLLKWIKGYYVHYGADPKFHSKVTFFQNITTTISIYKNSETSSKGRQRQQRFLENNDYTVLLVGKIDRYQEVEFYGELNRIAIVFHPCGINQFMREPLGPYLETHYSRFHYFDELFLDFLPKLFDEKSLEIKCQMLDAFFLTQFQLLNEPQLLQAVELLLKSEHQIQVNDLADRLEISRRTLLRKFKKHLGYSVEDYKSVIRFRAALSLFQDKKKEDNFTKMALDSEYYDQADFNRHIKSRTDLTPSTLFKELKFIDDTLFWKL